VGSVRKILVDFSKKGVNQLSGFTEHFRQWLLANEHPHSRLRIGSFFLRAGWIAVLLLLGLGTYIGASAINRFSILTIFRPSALIVLVVAFFFVKRIGPVLEDIFEAYRLSPNGFKLLLMLVVLWWAYSAYTNPGTYVAPIVYTISSIDWNTFNPIILK
jgi:hypothetical protein